MLNEKTKSIIIISVLIAIVCVLLGFLIYDNMKKSGAISTSESKEIMKDFDKYFNSKERTVIYYASSSCSWCSLQTPILETISSDYDMDYLYVDSSKLGKNQRENMLEKLGIEHGTPTTIIVEKGKVIAVAEGYQEASKYIEFFKENKMIPEDAVYSEEQYLNFVSYDEYKEIITKSGKNIVVVGQTTCSHCIAIKPALNSIAEDYDVTINYINIDKLDNDQREGFYASLTDIGYDDEDFLESGSFGTPLTLIMENGKVSSYLSGERTTSQLVKAFKKAGIIK